MRFMKLLGLVMCALTVIAMAGENKLGIKDVYKVNFSTPVRIGSAVLPQGQYVVRHKMEGEEHLMVFQREHSKDMITTKCTLVPLTKKAEQTQTVFEVTASNDRVLKELVFRGDLAKHVF